MTTEHTQGQHGENEGPVTVASNLSGSLRGRNFLAPIVTFAVALLCGAVVILAVGSNPFETYKAIFHGAGLDWVFPWVTGQEREFAAQNLQQTLLIMTPLILVGLAVAFAFRAGLFNIGGQGQYIAGAIASIWIGSSFSGMPRALHIILAIICACAAGAFWAGIAGFLRARAGANEVISTIMLNWIAVWVGVYLFGVGGPLQNKAEASIPISVPIAKSAHLPVIWGDPELQGLHIGIFLALIVAGLFYLFITRAVRGYEVRALGLNPEAASYGGIHVGRSYVRVMAICGGFAGLAGAMDILGWQFHLATNDVQTSTIGFLGIAVALLGRNKVFGVLVSSLFFAALINGTTIRNLDPNVFAPQLASNLTLILQGVIVLWVSAPVLIATIKAKRRKDNTVKPALRGEDVAA